MRKRRRTTPRTAKDCPECGLTFTGTGRQRFCSEKCSSIYRRKQNGKYPERRNQECARCGLVFETGKSWQRFCSRECAVATYNARWRAVNVTDLKLSTSTVGTISELLVASDLLAAGYDVFKSLSPACCCDLAILKEGKLYRVEVTTAHYGPSGKRMSPRKDNFQNYDIVAYVLRAGKEIEYEPQLP